MRFKGQGRGPNFCATLVSKNRSRALYSVFRKTQNRKRMFSDSLFQKIFALLALYFAFTCAHVKRAIHPNARRGCFLFFHLACPFRGIFRSTRYACIHSADTLRLHFIHCGFSGIFHSRSIFQWARGPPG